MSDAQHPASKRPRAGTRLGRIAGVPIRLNASWPVSLVIVVAVVALLAGRVLPHRSALSVIVAAVALTALLMLSVLLHELGHLFAGRAVGQRVISIRFDVLGGQTDLASARSSAGRDAFVAVAGPAVSAVCSVAGFGVAQAFEPRTGPSLLALTAGVVNALLTVFNLLPALPMDGGEMVRTAAWRISGNRRTGTIAGYLSTAVVCLLLLVFAVLLWFDGRSAGKVQGVILGAMAIHLAGTGWTEWTRERDEPGNRRVVNPDADPVVAAELAGAASPLTVLPATATVAQAIRARTEVVLVDDEGSVLGMVDRSSLAGAGPGLPAVRVASQTDPAAVLLPTDRPQQLAEALQRTSSDRFLLSDEDGMPAAILLRTELTRILDDRGLLQADLGGMPAPRRPPIEEH
ncbi:MAG: site-2 protease family protein [Actinomycetota bacterium]|nr:site-2 protease family protein [Actinomycetota bacterium]